RKDCLVWNMVLAPMVSLAETPPTGKPDAGNPPVRFGGRGGAKAPSLPLSARGRPRPQGSSNGSGRRVWFDVRGDRTLLRVSIPARRRADVFVRRDPRTGAGEGFGLTSGVIGRCCG